MNSNILTETLCVWEVGLSLREAMLYLLNVGRLCRLPTEYEYADLKTVCTLCTNEHVSNGWMGVSTQLREMVSAVGFVHMRRGLGTFVV